MVFTKKAVAATAPTQAAVEEQQRWWQNTSRSLSAVALTEQLLENAYVGVHKQYAKIEARGWTPKTPKKLYKAYKEALERSHEEAQRITNAVEHIDYLLSLGQQRQTNNGNNSTASGEEPVQLPPVDPTAFASRRSAHLGSPPSRPVTHTNFQPISQSSLGNGAAHRRPQESKSVREEVPSATITTAAAAIADPARKRKRGATAEPENAVTTQKQNDPEILRPGTTVAAHVNQDATDWIGAIVRSYNSNTKNYTVEDVDDHLQHEVSRHKVLLHPFPGEPPADYRPFGVGSSVLVMYPGTTCFYDATVKETGTHGKTYQVEFQEDDKPFHTVPWFDVLKQR